MDKPEELDLTKDELPKPAEIVTAFDEKGEFRVGHKLQPEDYEMLKTLANSRFWKHYRQLLIQTKDAYFNSMLGMKRSNEMVKTVGVVMGLNHAINAVHVLCAEYDRVQKEAIDKKEKKAVPFERG